MNSNVLWIEDYQDTLWPFWLAKIPNDKKDIYYTSEYVSLYQDKDTRANCFIFYDKGRIFFYPFLKSNIPFYSGYYDIFTPYGYGGPISSSDDELFLNEAFQCFKEEAMRKNIIAELIRFHPLLSNHVCLRKAYTGDIFHTCSTVYAEVGLEDDVRWHKVYTHANRKNISKARRNLVRVVFSQDQNAWDAFEKLYSRTMMANNSDRFYFFSEEYFQKIRNKLSAEYILVSCMIEERTIASMLVLIGPLMAHCHLTGSDNEYTSLGANNLLHHELIIWCKRKGYKKLHIGGGRTNEEDDSLLRFKKNFSDQISAFYVGESVLNREIYDQVCDAWREKNHDKVSLRRVLKYRF